MSGFVGWIRLDGRSAEPGPIAQMTEAMRFRGVSEPGFVTDGPAAFGYAIFGVSGSNTSSLPPSLLRVGETILIGDVRLDDRASLRRRIRASGHSLDSATSDLELVFRAWRAWGDDCVHALRGDFSFAIWEGQARRLFCVRDHFGVRPLYAVIRPDWIVFGNTPQAFNKLPDLPGPLDDDAIADFLLFGMIQDSVATPYRAVRRIPPAHCLTGDIDTGYSSFKTSRYWSLPTEGSIRYRRSSEYVEHFNELFDRAVADRLREGRASIYMSGGMDSAAIAAMAVRHQRSPGDLHAFTAVINALIPDNERSYAEAVSEALGIPISFRSLDGYAPFKRHAMNRFRAPEPVDNPHSAFVYDQILAVASHSQVALSGAGGDALFSPPTTHFTSLLRQRRLVRASKDVAAFLARHHRMPPLHILSSLRRRVRSTSRSAPTRDLAYWINTEFVERAKIEERWNSWVAAQRVSTALPHPSHPEAFSSLVDNYWPAVFESEDAGVSNPPLQMRYPYFDLRVVQYILSIPAFPWCLDKMILRQSMRGRLPDRVLRRPKTPLSGDPFLAQLRLEQVDGLRLDGEGHELDAYVDRKKAMDWQRRLEQTQDFQSHWISRPFSLAEWFERRSPGEM